MVCAARRANRPELSLPLLETEKSFSSDIRRSRCSAELRSSRLKPLLQRPCGKRLGALQEGLQPRDSPKPAQLRAAFVTAQAAPTTTLRQAAGCTVGGTSVPTASAAGRSTASLVATEVATTGSFGCPPGALQEGVSPEIRRSRAIRAPFVQRRGARQGRGVFDQRSQCGRGKAPSALRAGAAALHRTNVAE